MSLPKLVFVYNADSGLFNTLTDIAHKIFSPATYECQLCQITHGNLTMRDDWKAFISSIACSIEYLHRDEYLKRQSLPDANYPSVEFPAILINSGQPELLLSRMEISACNTVSALSELISQKLEKPDHM